MKDDEKTKKQLTGELRQMLRLDQEALDTLEFDLLGVAHASRLAQIVAQIGWPTVSSAHCPSKTRSGWTSGRRLAHRPTR